MKLKLSQCILIAALVSTMAWIEGCTNSSSDRMLKPINVLDAQQLVQSRKKMLGLAGTAEGVWVDSRPESDYRAGHIPGAVHIPFERVTLDHKKLDKYDVIIVYGGDYNDARANGMSKRLMELGHSDVRTLTGGMRAWKAEGNPVATATH